MKKLIVKLSLATLLFTAPMQEGHALTGAVASIWSAKVATNLAIAGLASPVLGGVGFYFFSKENGCDGGVCAVGLVMGAIVGLVLLEHREAFQFSKLTIEQANQLGLKINQVEIYNSEVDEVNILLKEVAFGLDEKSTFQATKRLWENYSEYVSPETFDVMITIADHNLR